MSKGNIPLSALPLHLVVLGEGQVGLGGSKEERTLAGVRALLSTPSASTASTTTPSATLHTPNHRAMHALAQLSDYLTWWSAAEGCRGDVASLLLPTCAPSTPLAAPAPAPTAAPNAAKKRKKSGAGGGSKWN
jgi:hypothetical protein